MVCIAVTSSDKNSPCAHKHLNFLTSFSIWNLRRSLQTLLVSIIYSSSLLFAAFLKIEVVKLEDSNKNKKTLLLLC